MRVMTDVDHEPVPAMARAIEARMAELNIPDVATLHRISGVSRPILGDLLAGLRKDYRRNVTAPFCSALQWRYDGVKLLLAGERPVELSSPLQREDVLGEVRELVAGMYERQEHLIQQVADLLRAARQRDDRDPPSPRRVER